MRRTAVLIFLALALAACQQAKPDPAALTESRALYDELRTGQDRAALSKLPPSADPAATAAVIAKLKPLIPATPPRSSDVVASNAVDTPAGRVEALVLEYDYPDRTARFETAYVVPKGTKALQLRTFRLSIASHRELAPNTLSLNGRSPAQLAFFALAVTSPLLMLAAVVKVLRTPGLGNRWLWVAFALVGLFSFKMNWATGTVLMQWMDLQIVGFWLGTGPSRFDPWFIGATVPIGALLILSGVVAKPARKT